MEISTETFLFGSMPVRPLDPENSFAKEIDEKYKLVLPVQTKTTNENNSQKQQQNNANKPRKIVKDTATDHKAIIKQSQGSKLFEMLKSVKAAPRLPQAQQESVKSVVPKRKLGMSKQ